MARPQHSFQLARTSHDVLRSSARHQAQFTPRVAYICARTLRTTAAPHDENKGRDKADFRSQLWQSTQQRVQRERAEQDRFAAMRAAGGGSGMGGGFAGSSLAWAVSVLGFSAFAYWFGTMRHSGAKPTASTLPLDRTVPPEHDISTKNLQAAWTDLKNIVGQEHVSTEEGDITSHAGSSWSSHQAPPDDRPFCIVRPETTEEVAKIVRVCHGRQIPVTAYSGGTSLEGHFAATRGGVCVDFSRMDQILSVNKDDMDVVVQPAVGWEALNDVLEDEGLFFPPDPGPGAMIGGMIGTGCSGTNAYRYGTMRDWVLSLTVVMADGTIVKTRRRPRKSSAGYDLTRLFIGSEGTLGLVTEATLKVTSAPQNVRVAVASFPTIKDAAECVFRVVKGGVPIAAVELLDDVQMKCVNDSGATSKKWDEAPTLFFKFNGTKQAVDESIGLVKNLAKEVHNKSFEFARNADEATELWSARKEALWSVMAKKRSDDDHVWTTDVAVPISRLPDIVEITKKDLAECGLTGAIVGHVGDGNFHAIILYGGQEERDVAEGVVHRMVKRAIEMEGTATGEHGVGLVKRDYLDHELGRSTVDAMRMLKRAWDPLCLLNCDKIVRAQPPKAGEVAEW